MPKTNWEFWTWLCVLLSHEKNKKLQGSINNIMDYIFKDIPKKNERPLSFTWPPRKLWTIYGSFFSHLELGQNFKILKNHFTDVIFRFHSTCLYNWQGRHICQKGYILSWTAPIFGLGHNMGRFASFVLGSTQLLHL